MNPTNQKNFTTSRGFNYAYYRIPAGKNGLPTVFLAHGFPDTALLWQDLVESHLMPAGYGVLAIDCLGYGGTSKPVDNEAYSWDLMAQDVAQLLTHEGINKVVSMGHDFGSAVAQRFYNFFPDRVNALVMLNVAYNPPLGVPFDLDAVIKQTEAALGYGCFHYWKVTASDEGPALHNSHIDSFWDLAHGKPETWRYKTFCQPDGYKQFLLQNQHQETEPYATEEKKAAFIARMKRDGFDAPLAYYRSMERNVQSKADATVPVKNRIVEVPTLYVGAAKDYTCPPAAIKGFLSIDGGFLPHLTTVVLDGGHFALLTNPEEFGRSVVDWLNGIFL